MYQAHRNYLSNILNLSLQENNRNRFWRYIKSRKADNIGVSPIRDEGRLQSHPRKKAELLNRQFKSVFTQEDASNIPEPSGPAQPPIEELSIENKGVQKLLERINPSKASGPDAIPNRVLKEAAEEISPILTAIFKQSIEQEQLPSDWKKAYVTPVFKKGDRHQPENYRPVSLTCVCCKLLEHIICRHILQHLEEHNILAGVQHGFRKGHSCETQLIETLHDLQQHKDNKHQVDVIVLDFSKAFDTVPHRRLLKKIKHLGVKGKIHGWIANFLYARSQQVIVEGERSKSVSVDSGVPQGTVLGPLLFLMHINDLPDAVNSQVRLFADDCLLYRPVNSIDDQHAIQNDLRGLETWATAWGMRFNAKKCYVLRTLPSARTKSKDYTYDLSGHALNEVNSTPYLGVTLSNSLKWDAHISSVCAKANATLGFVKRNLKFAPPELKATAYKSLVRSKLEYACTVWDPYRKKDIQDLEKVQRRAARFTSNDFKRTSSVTVMLQTLGWGTLEHRRRNRRIQMLNKIICNETGIPKESYTKPGPSRTRSSNNNKLAVYSAKSEDFKNSFFPRTIRDWNATTQAEINTISISAGQCHH